MTLQEYYKKQVAKYGYDLCERGKKITDLESDIYYNDEMDYYICADYYGMYVGDDRNWCQDDIDFLEVLGFGTGDFIENEMREGDENE